MSVCGWQVVMVTGDVWVCECNVTVMVTGDVWVCE